MKGHKEETSKELIPIFYNYKGIRRAECTKQSALLLVHFISLFFERFTQSLSPVCGSFTTCSSILYHPFSIPFSRVAHHLPKKIILKMYLIDKEEVTL